MLVANEFTPEVLLSAPRRGPGLPNHDGTLILYTQSTHIFGDKTLKEARIMNVETGQSEQLAEEDKVHDVFWMPGDSNDVVYLKSGEKGTTEIMIANGADLARDHYVAAVYEAPLRSLKLKALPNGTGVAFVLVGLVTEDGLLYNDKTEQKTSTGRIFDSHRVRVWNELYKPQKYVLWFSKLVLAHGKWGVAGELQNLLQGTDIEAPAGVYGAGDPLDNFDISHKGIAFVAEDPNIKTPELSGVSHVYYVPLHSFTAAAAHRPRQITMGLAESTGFYRNVRFSPDSSLVAFLQLPLNHPADARLYMGHLRSLGAFDIHRMVIGSSPKLPPSGFEFAGTSDAIFLTTEDCGRMKLSHLELKHGATPTLLVGTGVVTAYHPLKAGSCDKLLVTSNCMVDSSLWQIVDVSLDEDPKVVSSATKHGAKFGLSHRMVSEFWYEGADDSCVHSFIVKPSNFDENKKYPWILMPHGGPEAAWMDTWSTRWNMALWAQRGYVIVCPNIAGSTGYGIDFTARIYRSWGGAPFQDLVNLMEYLNHLPYLDTSRAVIAGASYGGYMISWIFGHSLARRFCAAIWHDGIFNLPVFMLQTDSCSTSPDFNGVPYPWINWDELERWNPARPELLRNWKHAPPTLIVHSEKDYRCPITEGLATYNTLRGHGVRSRFLTFSDECHWVLNPENSKVWHETVFDWIEKFAPSGARSRSEDLEVRDEEAR